MFLLADVRLGVCQHFSPISLLLLNVLGNANRVDYRKLGVEATECAGLISVCRWSLCILNCRLTIEPRDCYWLRCLLLVVHYQTDVMVMVS